MATYSPLDAYALRPREQLLGRVVTVPPGATLLHVAAAESTGPDSYEQLAAANGVIDPIPFPDVPPRTLRAMSVWAGKTLRVPDALF